jgi:hypothetical protein
MGLQTFGARPASAANWRLVMLMNIRLRKAGGFWLTLVTVLGLGLMLLAMPALGRPGAGVQPMSGAHPSHPVVVPNRDTIPSSWPHRQQFLNVQNCGPSPFSQGYDVFSGSSPGYQPCAAACLNSQAPGSLDPDATSWYDYNRSETAWWSYPTSNVSPAFGPCGGFSGWWTP